jgi:hypothetical protein
MRKIITAALALAITLTLSCSDDKDDGGGNAKITKAKISGVSQKGPFVEGSKAILHELDESFAKTGRSFTEMIADDKGSFEIKGVELASPYAVLEASGQYLNEVTGNVTSGTISLFAIADVREKDNVNVNILTHLEYYRVLNLVEKEGKSIKEAKTQAQKEILDVFGINSDSFKNSEDMSIFGTSESDAALLAISILLQGELNEGEFLQRLTKFSKSIEETGRWDNEAEKDKMAEWVRGNQGYGMEMIRDNILSWELSSSVPDFGKYLYRYWITNWGLDDCSNENDGSIIEHHLSYDYLPCGICDGSGEFANTMPYICKDGTWCQASFHVDVIYENGVWRAKTEDEVREHCQRLIQEIGLETAAEVGCLI